MASPRDCLLVVCAAVAAAAPVGCEKNTRDTDIKLVSVGEAKALWDRAQTGTPDLVLFVDPRIPKYYDAGHIPGARNLQMPQVDAKAPRDPGIERYANIVVYGDNPADPVAKGMTKRLLELGYHGVRWFADGMTGIPAGWQLRGYPIASSTPVAPPGAAPAAETGATGATNVPPAGPAAPSGAEQR